MRSLRTKASTESFKISSFSVVDLFNFSTESPSTLPQPFLQQPTPGIGTPGVHFGSGLHVSLEEEASDFAKAESFYASTFCACG